VKRVLGTAAAVAALALVAGCGDSTDPAAPGLSPSASGSGLSGTVTVFAAASLTESFGTLGKQFPASP
jgi:molybdate transport system substrate-binding protein